MKKRVAALLLLFSIVLTLCAFSAGTSDSTFCITFIDVGQGDSALVECDGHYMLIDGGNKSAGDQVYNVLRDYNVWELDILVISHLHEDHFRGFEKALTYVSEINQTLCNSNRVDTEAFESVEQRISECHSRITVPEENAEYQLGSATVKVIDASNKDDNDSLVLLITYGRTKFLFTGDIEESAQTRIAENYQADAVTLSFWEKLLGKKHSSMLVKMPHHGAYTFELESFLKTFSPEYAIISVGYNKYGHPDEQTLDILNSKERKVRVFRTDESGNITVTSNGKKITVKTER